MARVIGVQRRLVEYMREKVQSAKGNVVTIVLKKAAEAAGAETKAEVLAVKAALDGLAALGLLEADGEKPRYIIRRGSPLWMALVGGHVELVAVITTKCAKKPKYRRKKRR
jgi:hypothetical protein